jgi:MATE family multidrug resistance protein
MGLCVGLIVAGLALTTVWRRTTRSLSAKSLVSNR